MVTVKIFGNTFFGLIAATLLTLGMPASAENDTPSPRIVVSGEGSVSIPADLATLALTVSREANTARAALDANSKSMNEVLRAMAAQGVAQADLQTSNFSVQPRYFYPKPTANGERGQRQIVGYTVRNSLTVRVRELDKLGPIIDQSITKGVNEGGNISFGNDDPSAALDRARTLAMHNAIAKANTLANAAGVKLGKILEISERSNSQRPPPMARSMAADSSGAVPVASGENAYQVRVNVSFAIDQ